MISEQSWEMNSGILSLHLDLQVHGQETRSGRSLSMRPGEVLRRARDAGVEQFELHLGNWSSLVREAANGDESLAEACWVYLKVASREPGTVDSEVWFDHAIALAEEAELLDIEQVNPRRKGHGRTES